MTEAQAKQLLKSVQVIETILLGLVGLGIGVIIEALNLF